MLGLTGNLIWHWHAGCFSSLKYWLMDAHVNYQSVDSFVIYCSANELSESEKHLMQCTRVYGYFHTFLALSNQLSKTQRMKHKKTTTNIIVEKVKTANVHHIV